MEKEKIQNNNSADQICRLVHPFSVVIARSTKSVKADPKARLPRKVRKAVDMNRTPMKRATVFTF